MNLGENMVAETDSTLPLAGIRILDLSLTLPGPYASHLLAQMGAEVTRIVPPWGDPAQEFLPALDWLHEDKKTLRLDLKADIDRRTALDEAARADIVMEGFRPGVAARLGVGVEAVAAVNSRVVYCSLSGYGQTGAFSRAPGHDINYQSLAGTMELMAPGGLTVGAHPPMPLSDLAMTVYALVGILAGLRSRDAHGQGCFLDLAAADSMVSLVGPYLHARAHGEILTKDMPHYGTFQAADGGWVSLGGIYEQHFWTRLVQALDLPAAWADFDVARRQSDITAIRAEIVQRVAALPRDQCVELLRSADVPVMAVDTPRDAIFGEHFEQRGVTTAKEGRRRVGLPFRVVHLASAAQGPEGEPEDEVANA
ncbi:MAG: CaiB/BaiF CoA transferase family protein [Acidimicrobiales bacterium]